MYYIQGDFLSMLFFNSKLIIQILIFRTFKHTKKPYFKILDIFVPL